MAEAIPRKDWLEAEEIALRTTYMEYLVERWLWQAPFALLQDSSARSPGLRVSTPSPRALQHYGWILEPTSQASH